MLKSFPALTSSKSRAHWGVTFACGGIEHSPLLFCCPRYPPFLVFWHIDSHQKKINPWKITFAAKIPLHRMLATALNCATWQVPWTYAGCFTQSLQVKPVIRRAVEGGGGREGGGIPIGTTRTHLRPSFNRKPQATGKNKPLFGEITGGCALLC